MLKKYFLFSLPTEQIKPVLCEFLLKDAMALAYMPSDGADPKNPKWQKTWEDMCNAFGVKFVNIDNSKFGHEAEQESVKLLNCDRLVICGGNTFTLLRNLRQSGLDRVITDFANRQDTKIAGFSAGALVLFRDVKLALTGDENSVGLVDFTGLGLVQTEIYPHYSTQIEPLVQRHEQENNRKVIRLTDEEYIIAN